MFPAERTSIGITGPIGSGKSTVSRVLSLHGFPVYDCDFEARRIMNADTALRSELCKIAGCNLYLSGSLNRPLLASIIFSSPEKRLAVNTLVHAAVRADISRLLASASLPPARPLFIESALLHTSGLHKMVSRIWLVSAPASLRLSRIQSRNPDLSRSEILSRMDAQASEFCLLPADKVSTLLNDGHASLLEQIYSLMSNL